jgi:hypothetical protein
MRASHCPRPSFPCHVHTKISQKELEGCRVGGASLSAHTVTAALVSTQRSQLVWAGILGERGLRLGVHFPSGCVARIYTPSRSRSRSRTIYPVTSVTVTVTVTYYCITWEGPRCGLYEKVQECREPAKLMPLKIQTVCL